MLTPDQLEAAARRLCKLRGMDPDEPCGKWSYEGKTEHGPAWWELLADEITARLQMDEALAGVTSPLEDGP